MTKFTRAAVADALARVTAEALSLPEGEVPAPQGDRLVAIMQHLKIPNGLRAVGYRKSDIPALVQGTLPQARVTKLSPRPVAESDLAHLFEEALQGW